MNNSNLLQDETETPFSLWYYLCGRPSDNRLSQNEHTALTTTGVACLLVSLSYGIFNFIMFSKVVSNSTFLGFITSLLVVVFSLFFFRSIFVYIQKRNRNSKWVAIGIYLAIGILGAFILSYCMLFFFLETEINSHVSQEQFSSLHQSEALQLVMESLNQQQQQSVQNFRWIVGTAFLLISCLPLLNILLFIRNANVKISDQNQMLLLELKQRLFEQKQLYANISQSTNSTQDGFFIEEATPELIQQKKNEILAEMQNIQEAIDLL